MIRKLTILLLLSLFAIIGFAQQTGDIIYVYQKDGDVLPFLRNEISEFYYSFEDEEGVTHENPVMQLIVLEDSICKIPLTNIDSISFVTPATIYRPGVVRIEEGLMSYVISCNSDDLTLLLAADTPSDIIPKVGDKLVTTVMNDQFEAGFIGVVNHVTKGSDGITVACDNIDLEDVFETYYNTTFVQSTSEDEQATSSRAAKSDDIDITWTMPTISYAIGTEYQREVKKIDDLVWKVGTKGEVSLTPTLRIKNSIIVGKEKRKRIIGSIKGDFELKEALSFYGGLEWQKDFGLKVYKKGIAPLCFFYIKPGVFVKAALTASISAGWTQHFNTTFHYDYDNKRSQKLKSRLEAKKPTNNFEVEAMIDGSISAGVFTELGVSFLTEKLDNISWRGEYGAELVGHAVLYNNDIKDADADTKAYEILKSSGIECNLVWSSSLQAKIGKSQWNAPFGPALSTNIEKWDLVPTFDQIEFEQCYSPRTSANARVEMKGKCILPLTVGLVVKDKDGNKVDSWNANDKFQKGNQQIATKFTDLTDGDDYKLQPKLVIFDIDLLANPSVDLEKNPFPVQIIRFEQTGSKYSKQKGFEYDGRNYFYKFNARTTVELAEGVEKVKDWGYVYVDFYGEHKKISCANQGSLTYPDERYAYYYNDPQRTVELYPYVQFEGETEIQAGKHKVFPVEYKHDVRLACPDHNHPHAIDLGLPSGTKWACCNIGAETPDAAGDRYRWGEVTVSPGDSEKDYLTYPFLDKEAYANDQIAFFEIGDDIADTQYDAARAKWGGAWRMPSDRMFKELKNLCSHEFTEINGTYGCLLTGPNGRTIFLAAEKTVMENYGKKVEVLFLDAGKKVECDSRRVIGPEMYWSSTQTRPNEVDQEGWHHTWTANILAVGKSECFLEGRTVLDVEVYDLYHVGLKLASLLIRPVLR